MINLLPPQVKEQLKASKANVVLRHYILLLFIFFVLLFSLMAGAYLYANKQITQLSSALDNRKQQRKQYDETENKVKTLQKNISLIEKLFTNKTEFSGLLQDLASAMPAGAYINKISLTGDEKEPVELLINVDSPEKAGVLRNALNASSRIKSVDIQSVSKDTNVGGYVVEVVIAFEPGATQ